VSEQSVIAPRERLWKVPDVAGYLSVSESWVYLHVSQGDLPYKRIGGLLRFDSEAIRRFAAGEASSQAQVLLLRSNGA
jgi:excisionase family DNA binding protein